MQRVVGAAIGAVAEEVADPQPAPPVGGDGGVVAQQCRGHGRWMRGDAGAEIERHMIEMIA